MNRRCILLTTVCLLGIHAFVSAQSTQTREHERLHVWTELAKESYGECEEVWLYLFLENPGGDAVVIPEIRHYSRRQFHVNVYDSTGDSLEYTGLIGYPVSGDDSKLVITPCDTILVPFELVDFFGLGGWHTRYPPGLPTGNYSVDGTLFGTLKTEKLKFAVHPLDPVSDSLVAQYWGIRTRQRDRSSQLDEMWQLVQREPDSPIASRICAALLGNAATLSAADDRRFRYSQYLVTNYPEHPAIQGAIYFLLDHGSDSEFVSYFSGIAAVRKSPITRLLFRQTLKRAGRVDLLREVMRQ